MSETERSSIERCEEILAYCGPNSPVADFTKFLCRSADDLRWAATELKAALARERQLPACEKHKPLRSPLCSRCQLYARIEELDDARKRIAQLEAENAALKKEAQGG